MKGYLRICFKVKIPQGRGYSVTTTQIRGTQRQFLENICSEDDLKSY